jgi:hypothetical protein
MNLGYDGVIFKDISETLTNSIITDDYVVFDIKQVRPY